MKRIANRIHALASAFADALVSDGLNVVHKVFFDTVTVDFGSKEKADQVFAAALDRVTTCAASTTLKLRLRSMKRRHTKIWSICTAHLPAKIHSHLPMMSKVV